MITKTPAPARVAPPPRGPSPYRERRLPAWLVGPVVMTLLIAAIYVGIKAAYGGFGSYYDVTMTVPRAGQLLLVGSDVRESGVVIGTVKAIQLQSRHVVVTMQIDRRYRIPASAQGYVTLKTFLGEKYVDLRAPSYSAPFLRSGQQLVAGHVGPELEDALQDGVNVLTAIRPADAATVVVTLASAARGHGQDIARSIQANSQLSALFAQTLQPQLRSLYDFDVIFGALKSKGVDINRLAAAINQGVPVYASAAAQRDLERALDALVPFANNLADLLTLNRADWDRMMTAGDAVLGTIAARPAGLSSLVVGLYHYVWKLSGDPYMLADGSGSAGFTDFMGGDTPAQTISQICGALPPDLSARVPLCNGTLPPPSPPSGPPGGGLPPPPSSLPTGPPPLPGGGSSLPPLPGLPGGGVP